MNSGKLRHRGEIQNAIDVRDEFGAISYQEWVSFAYCWMQIEPLSGREYFAAAQIQSEISHKITMRYKSGIKPHYRILWNSRVFDIQSIINIREENRELILYCSEADIGS